MKDSVIEEINRPNNVKQEPLSAIRRARERHSSQGDENKSYSVELESVGAVRYTKTERVCDSTSGMSSTTTLTLESDSTVQTTVSQECASSSQGDENKSYSVELESVGAVRYTKTERVCDSTSGMSSTTTLTLEIDSTVQTTVSQECASSSQGDVKDMSPIVVLNSVGAIRQATTEGVSDPTSGMSTLASLIDLLPHLQPMHRRECEYHNPVWWTIWMCLCIFVKGLFSSLRTFSVSEWSGWQSMVSAQLTPFIMYMLAMTLQDDGRLQRRRRKRQKRRRQNRSRQGSQK